MKKWLAALLVFAMALTLALPAMAAVDWDDFHIITQTQDLAIKKGESFTLRVEVNVPDGAEVKYQWYRYGSEIPGATASALQLSPSDPDYPQMPKATSGNYHYYRLERYCCVIDANDPDGTELDTATLRSGDITVRVENSFWEKLYSVTLEPFVFAIMGTIGAFIWVGPLALTGSLYFLVERYITNFRELFH